MTEIIPKQHTHSTRHDSAVWLVMLVMVFTFAERLSAACTTTQGLPQSPQPSFKEASSIDN